MQQPVVSLVGCLNTTHMSGIISGITELLAMLLFLAPCCWTGGQQALPGLNRRYHV